MEFYTYSFWFRYLSESPNHLINAINSNYGFESRKVFLTGVKSSAGFDYKISIDKSCTYRKNYFYIGDTQYLDGADPYFDNLTLMLSI